MAKATTRLGCLDSIDVYVTDQCGSPRICSLTNVQDVSFNRVLDDISEAIVTVAVGSGVSTSKPCCDCLDLIEPWCHELQIIRNGELVWTGPIIAVTYGYEKVAIEARDVVAWTQVRIPIGKLDNVTAKDASGNILYPNGQEITDIAMDVLETAFNEHDPCVLDYVVQTDLNNRPTLFANTKVSPENGFSAFEGTVFDWLELLADNGLDYTTIGRSIVLSVENVNQAQLGTLRDEHILGEVEVTKDGYSMATRIWTRFEQDDNADQCEAQNPDLDSIPCPALSEAANIRNSVNERKGAVCYGPIERLFDDSAPFDYTTAKQTGDAYIRDGSVAPRLVNFPSGTRLSPDTPWGINDMVPGQKIFTSLSGLCLEVHQPFKILEMTYSLSSGGDEEISISLGAFNILSGL